MIFGLRRVAKALGCSPQIVFAHGRWLQPRLAKLSPAALGLSIKGWQNPLSDARSAMAHVGFIERRKNRITDLSPEWQTLWASVLASKDKSLRPPLGRFIHFLNSQEIKPNQVCHEHALAYRDALAHNEISKSPDVAYRAAVNGWNLAGRHTWPVCRRERHE